MAGAAFLKTSSQVNFSAPWNLSLHIPCGENAGAFGKALRSSSFNSKIWALIASRPWAVRRKVASDTSSVSKWTGALFFFSLFLEVCWALLSFLFFFGLVKAFRAFWALRAIACFRDRPFAPRVIVGATFHCFISGILPRTSALSGVRVTLTSPDPSRGWWPHCWKASRQFTKKESTEYKRTCTGEETTKWWSSASLTVCNHDHRYILTKCSTEWYALLVISTKWYSYQQNDIHLESAATINKCTQMQQTATKIHSSTSKMHTNASMRTVQAVEVALQNHSLVRSSETETEAGYLESFSLTSNPNHVSNSSILHPLEKGWKGLKRNEKMYCNFVPCQRMRMC